MRRARPVILLFLLVTCFYWKLTLSTQFEWMWGSDSAKQVLPWLDFQAREMHRGSFPLWDPLLWAGQPLLAQVQPGTAYPLNWLLFLSPLDHGHLKSSSLNWYLVLIHFLAAWFAYILARDLRCLRSASIFAGLLYGLGGYVGNTYWPQQINGTVWAPLVFLFLLRATAGEKPVRNAVIGGFFLGMAWLAGHHQPATLLSVAAGIAWLLALIERKSYSPRAFLPIAIFFAMGIVTGALQTLPAAEYGLISRRWAAPGEGLAWNQPVPYSVHQMYQTNPSSLWGIVFPGLTRNFDPFLGITGFAFALIGLTVMKKRPIAKFFAAMALLSLLFALAGHSIFHGVLYALVPMVEKARSPSAALFLFGLGASMLAAFGLDEARQRIDPAAVRALLWFGVVSAFLFQAALFFKKLSFDAEDRIVMPIFAAFVVIGLMKAFANRAVTQRIFVAGIVLICMVELGNDSGYGFADTTQTEALAPLRAIRGSENIATFLRAQPGNFRAWTKDEVPFLTNWGDYHDVPMWEGFLASATANLIELPFYKRAMRHLLGVKYLIATKPDEEFQREVYRDDDGLTVYSNEDVFARARLVYRAEQMPSRSAIDNAMNVRFDDFHSRAFVTGTPPPVEACPSQGNVVITSYKALSVQMHTESACDAILILSDTYFPGWQGRVDRQPAQIFEADGALRGMLVPKGPHTVTMRYRPSSVYLGAALSFIALVLTLVIAWRSRSAPGPA